MGDFTWRVSDCEELSGGFSQEMMGLVLGIFLLIHAIHLLTNDFSFLYSVEIEKNIYRKLDITSPNSSGTSI